MQPGSPIDDRKSAIRKRPPSGLRGWAAAWSVLERVERDDHREILSRLVREGGMQGTPALKYMALCLCCEAGLRLPEAAPAGLPTPHVELIDRRARELLAPHGNMFPLRRKHGG